MRCIAKLYSVDTWHLIANDTKRRDHYRCQSCLKRFKMEALTVHHIFSRDLGGDDDPDNLITLCGACHDEIEDLGYMTAEQIRGFLAQPEEKQKALVEEIKEKELEERRAKIDAERPEWHKWVYGGARNPILDRGKS